MEFMGFNLVYFHAETELKYANDRKCCQLAKSYPFPPYISVSHQCPYRETSSNQWSHIKTTFQHVAALIVLDISTWLIVDVFYVFEEQMITNSSICTQKLS